VALVQLRRLDGLLTAMRQRKVMLKSSIQDIARRRGVEFRRINDEMGDAAIALVLYLPDLDTTRRVAGALEADGLDSWHLFDPDHEDYHVYYHWSPIMNQRTWSPYGGPWRSHPRKIEYTPDMCPRSLKLLGRALNLDISPELTNDQVEEMADALNKVLKAVA